MAAKSRSWLLKKRTWLGAAAAVGVLIGINFPEFWKGFGGGGASLFGTGSQPEDDSGSTKTAAHIAQVSNVKSSGQGKSDSDETLDETPDVVRVLIAERAFAIVNDEGDERPASLAQIVRLARRVPGDVDGIKLRVERKPSSRYSAEEALREALADAGVSEEAILWVPAASE